MIMDGFKWDYNIIMFFLRDIIEWVICIWFFFRIIVVCFFFFGGEDFVFFYMRFLWFVFYYFICFGVVFDENDLIIV